MQRAHLLPQAVKALDTASVLYPGFPAVSLPCNHNPLVGKVQPIAAVQDYCCTLATCKCGCCAGSCATDRLVVRCSNVVGQGSGLTAMPSHPTRSSDGCTSRHSSNRSVRYAESVQLWQQETCTSAMIEYPKPAYMKCGSRTAGLT